VASLVVIRRANSLVLIFHCMTVSALMSLRHQWSSGQLKDILESLFTLLSAATRIVRVKNIKWPLADYERYLSVIKSLTVRSCVVNRKLWHLNDYRCLVIWPNKCQLVFTKYRNDMHKINQVLYLQTAYFRGPKLKAQKRTFVDFCGRTVLRSRHWSVRH